MPPYFERMIAYPAPIEKVNQLEHVISTFQDGNHRRSALQISIFDPQQDHTRQRRRGFPCLQQVTFFPDGKGGLRVAGVLAVQYLFDRAYGNYLGLHRLGQFMSREKGLNLAEVSCIVGIAQRGNPSKAALAPLVSGIEELGFGSND